MTKEQKHELFLQMPWEGETTFRKTPDYPRVFYLGKGKTGSSALCRGIKEKTAHWHSTWYFENVNRHDQLSSNNLTMYDFVEWINENIHLVVVIEAYRDPIAQYFSALRQWFGEIDLSKAEALFVDKQPQITFQKEIEKPDSSLKVLYLKTEDSHLWENKLLNYDIIYKPDIINASSNEWKAKISKVKIPKWQLDRIYNHKKVQTLYSKEEIEGFYNKWGYGDSGYKRL